MWVCIPQGFEYELLHLRVIQPVDRLWPFKDPHLSILQNAFLFTELTKELRPLELLWHLLLINRHHRLPLYLLLPLAPLAFEIGHRLALLKLS